MEKDDLGSSLVETEQRNMIKVISLEWWNRWLDLFRHYNKPPLFLLFLVPNRNELVAFIRELNLVVINILKVDNTKHRYVVSGSLSHEWVWASVTLLPSSLTVYMARMTLVVTWFSLDWRTKKNDFRILLEKMDSLKIEILNERGEKNICPTSNLRRKGESSKKFTGPKDAKMELKRSILYQLQINQSRERWEKISYFDECSGTMDN